MVLAFCGAGIIQLKNGIGIIIGSNLGTTFTGWIVASLGFKFNIETFVMPFLAIGGLGLIFLSKSEKLSNFSKLIAGFGFLFLGLSFMKNGISELSSTFDITLFQGKSLFIFLLFGFFLSGTIQSSSAVMVIVLSALDADILAYKQAAATVIGSDLGTTLTALIASFGGNTIKKQAGFSHFFFNLFTALIAFIFLPQLLYIIENIFEVHDPLIALVAFHSTFNLLGVIIFTPLLGSFSKFVISIIKEKENGISKHLKNVNPLVSEASVETLKIESLLFFHFVLSFNKNIFKSDDIKNTFFNDDFNYLAEYEKIKKYEAEIALFYAKTQQNELTESESKILSMIILSVRNASLSAKYLKDIFHNLNEIRNSTEEYFPKLYSELVYHQNTFYCHMDTVLELKETFSDEDEIPDLIAKNKDFSNKEIELIYKESAKLKSAEVEISSVLNMLMEIYNSNRSIIRSLSEIKKANTIL
jgi:phosphate:Na+ symporter